MADRRQQHTPQSTAILRSSGRPFIWQKGPLSVMVAVFAVVLIALLFAGGAIPASQAADPSAAPKAYVGLFQDNAVAVLDTGTNHVLTKITVPPGPHGLVATPDGSRVYVSSDASTKVSIIDTATDKVTGSIDVGANPHGLAITPDGKYVLVAVNGADRVAWIDTATNTVIGTAPVPMPHNIVVSPDGATAFVAAQKPGSMGLVILDVKNRKQLGTVPLDKAPRALYFCPAGKRIYFTLAGDNSLQMLDPATRSIEAQIPLGASPHQPFFTPETNLLLVVVQGPGELAIINPMTNQVSANVKVGTFPHWVASTPDGRIAYVTNEGANSVSVVDLLARRVTATIPIGNAPRKIIVVQSALDPVVNISNFAFAPPSIEIASGQVVTWVNKDTVPHTVTSNDGRWDSGRLVPGATYSHMFLQRGTYTYRCTIHPFMRGTVVVK